MKHSTTFLLMVLLAFVFSRYQEFGSISTKSSLVQAAILSIEETSAGNDDINSQSRQQLLNFRHDVDDKYFYFFNSADDTIYKYYFVRINCIECICMTNENNSIVGPYPFYYLFHPKSIYDHFLGNDFCLNNMERLPYTFGFTFALDFPSIISLSFSTIAYFAREREIDYIREMHYLFLTSQASNVLYTWAAWRLAARYSGEFEVKIREDRPNNYFALEQVRENATLRHLLRNTRLDSKRYKGNSVSAIIIEVINFRGVLEYLQFLKNNTNISGDSFRFQHFDALDKAFAYSGDETNCNTDQILSMLNLLVLLETTLALDITWIDITFLFGYLKPSNEKVNVVVYSDSLFCNLIASLFPILSKSVGCLLFSISTNAISSTLSTDNYRSLLHPDLVRRHVTDWAISNLNIDYYFFFAPNIKVLEGFLRASIYISSFNTFTPNFGCFIISRATSLSQAEDIIFMFPHRFISSSCPAIRRPCSTFVDLLFDSTQTAAQNNLILVNSISSLFLSYHLDLIFEGLFEFEYDIRMLNCPTEGCRKHKSIELYVIRRQSSIIISELLKSFYVDNKSIHILTGKSKSEFDLEFYGLNSSKIVFITAIFGSYEASCKAHAMQDVMADFICFTDNPNIQANNWEVDTTPYHEQFWEQASSDDFAYFRQRNITPDEIKRAKNSPFNNKHPFMTAKFYKAHFHLIPRLKKYDVVVWLDGTISIHHSSVASLVYNKIVHNGSNYMTFEHIRHGRVDLEVQIAMQQDKYNSASFNGIEQPIQELDKQLEAYHLMGYTHDYWLPGGEFDSLYLQKAEPSQVMRPHRGLWVTCFVAFDMRRSDTIAFLEAWYEHILFFSTQDQVSFPFVAQMLKSQVFSLPAEDLVIGDVMINEWFRKRDHGK